MASVERSMRPTQLKKPWFMSGYWMRVTGTLDWARRVAKASPSSRREVVAGGYDVGLGEVGEGFGADWGGVGVGALGGVFEVEVPEPDHGVAGEAAAGAAFGVGWVADGVVVGDGVDEQLGGDRRAAFVADADCGDGGEVGPGAVAGEAEAGGVGAEGWGVGGDPDRCGEGVVGGGGKFVFGGEGVVDGDDDGSGAAADLPAHGVVRVDAADDEAAAVEEDGHGAAGGVVGAVDADADWAARTGDVAVLG